MFVRQVRETNESWIFHIECVARKQLRQNFRVLIKLAIIKIAR